MIKATLLLVTSLLLATSALIAQAAGSDSPDFVFSLPGHPQQHLNSYQGHVIALEFINTGCSHCRAAAKAMNKIQSRFGTNGFQAIEIAINDDAASLVGKFAADRHLTFPVGWTTRSQMLGFIGYTGYAILPQVLLIDKNGRIRYRTPQKGEEHDAAIKEDVITSRIQALLQEPGGEKNSASSRVAPLASQ